MTKINVTQDLGQITIDDQNWMDAHICANSGISQAFGIWKCLVRTIIEDFVIRPAVLVENRCVKLKGNRSVFEGVSEGWDIPETRTPRVLRSPFLSVQIKEKLLLYNNSKVYKL